MKNLKPIPICDNCWLFCLNKRSNLQYSGEPSKPLNFPEITRLCCTDYSALTCILNIPQGIVCCASVNTSIRSP